MLRRFLALVVLCFALPSFADNIRVRNVSGYPVTLPLPYNGVLAPGASVIISSTLATVNANLGSAVGPVFDTYLVASSNTPTASAAAAPTGSIPTASLANSAVTTAKVDPSLVQSTTLTLTNAQIKAMHATPITLVAAAGAGKVIVPIACHVYLKYGGTNAFTSAAASVLAVKRAGGADLFVGGPQAFVQATASTVNSLAASATTSDAKTVADNVALQVWNNNASEIAGNNALDNSMSVVLTYRVDSAPAGW